MRASASPYTVRWKNLPSYENSDLSRKFLFYQMNVCV